MKRSTDPAGLLKEVFNRVKTTETSKRNPDVELDDLLTYMTAQTASIRPNTDVTIPTFLLADGVGRVLAVRYAWVETSTGPHTISLPAVSSLVMATPLSINDRTGSGSTNPITVLPAGGHSIDGQTSRLIGSNFGHLTIAPDLSDGDWHII